ncbi:MAG: methyltransferase domain-containing protein [Burkholderiaceae bacterium]
MAGFASQGWQVHGLEPNASIAAHAREQFGFTVTEGAIDDAAEGFELAGQAAAFDLVVAIQLVAHLRDPQAGFRAMARLLRPGGLLLVETWNSASRTARWLARPGTNTARPTCCITSRRAASMRWPQITG